MKQLLETISKEQIKITARLCMMKRFKTQKLTLGLRLAERTGSSEARDQKVKGLSTLYLTHPSQSSD